MTRILVTLFRLRLALLNGVTALGGVCLFPAPVQAVNLLAAFCGVALLAMGGSAFNQLLERDLDALMTRTMLRPLPQGRLSTATVAFAGACTILTGIVLLATTGGLLPPLLGLAATAWYLAVYTPLKRKTTLALPIGALCGAFPPLIGWCLAGGDPNDYRIITLAGVLFIWQIPHFWLLQERHCADYRRAGVPLVAAGQWLFGLWIVALTAATLMLPAFGTIGRPASLWYTAFPVPLLLLALMRSRRLLFMYLNLFPLQLMLVLFFASR
ncbi:MAG: protoheme IX farnesyltransferase [Desulfuromonadaceae bacterium]